MPPLRPWRNATQAVPGVGPKRARIMLVGEQPGDQEDLQGLPSSARPARCWTARWPKLAWRAMTST
jgi:uracil-DNA glycosylase family 4